MCQKYTVFNEGINASLEHSGYLDEFDGILTPIGFSELDYGSETGKIPLVPNILIYSNHQPK